MRFLILMTMIATIPSYHARKMKICPGRLPDNFHTVIVDGACYIFNPGPSLAGQGCEGKLKMANIRNKATEYRIIAELKYLNWTGQIIVGRLILSRPKRGNISYIIAEFDGKRLMPQTQIREQDRVESYKHICQYRAWEYMCRSRLLSKTEKRRKVTKIMSTCYEFISRPQNYTMAGEVCKQQHGQLARINNRSKVKLARKGLQKLNVKSYSDVWVADSAVVYAKQTAFFSDTCYDFVDAILRRKHIDELADKFIMNILEMGWINEDIRIYGHFQLKDDNITGNAEVDAHKYYYAVKNCVDFSLIRVQLNETNNVPTCHPSQRYKIYQPTIRHLIISDSWYVFAKSDDPNNIYKDTTTKKNYVFDNITMDQVLKKTLEIGWMDQDIRLHYLFDGGARQSVVYIDGTTYYFAIAQCQTYSILCLKANSGNIMPTCGAGQRYNIYQFKASDDWEKNCDTCRSDGRSILRIDTDVCCNIGRPMSCKISNDQRLPYICEYNSLTTVLTP